MDHVNVLEMEEYGLYAQNTSPVITNCVFSGTGLACIHFDSLASSSALISRSIVTGSEGRGISLFYHCTPVINNCVIYGNGTSGIHCEDRSDATIVNNTIYGNGYYGIYCFWNSSPTIMNNIIANSDLYGIYSHYSSLPVNSYNDVWNNHLSVADSLRFDYYGDYCEPGDGDISSNPMFMDAGTRDFHLNSGSPCIDTGNPDSDYNDSNGSRNDMGAYGGPEGSW
jgi:parallel beta-helix repeat protein